MMCWGNFNLSPNSYDLFFAGSSSSNTSIVSSGVSVLSPEGAVTEIMNHDLYPVLATIRSYLQPFYEPWAVAESDEAAEFTEHS